MNKENTMKLSHVCALAVLLVVGTTLALADSINDPKVIIHGVNGGNIECGPHNCQGVGQNFSFTVPEKGSGTLYFTNASGKNWTSLALIETGVPAADISCAQQFFVSCTTKTLKNGSVEILLSGVKGDNKEQGILANENFAIAFACVQGKCWPGGLQFTAHAGAAPEPGTVALMVTGIGLIFSRRKAWKNRFNS
jgi:hypothetical protein